MAADGANEGSLTSLQKSWQNNHNLWLAARSEAISGAKQHFSSLNSSSYSLQDLFTYFAKCRLNIALQLKQPGRLLHKGKITPAEQVYGYFRQVPMSYSCMLFSSESDESTTMLYRKGRYADFFDELKNRLTQGGRRVWVVKASPCNSSYSSMILSESGNAITIKHTQTIQIQEAFDKCNKAFQRLLESEELEVRVWMLAKIIWYLSQAMPCRGGSASITEMVQDFILEQYIAPLLNNVEYHYHNNLTVDLDAIFSERDDFIKHYADKIFSKKTGLQLTEQTGEQTYEQYAKQRKEVKWQQRLDDIDKEKEEWSSLKISF